MVTVADFARAVLTELQDHSVGTGPTQQAIDAFVAWRFAEGSDASWNPYDTEWNLERGTTDYNDAGVKNYANMEDGVTATYLTLCSAPYTSIRDSLSGAADNIAQAIARSSWGTETFVSLVAAVQADRPKYWTQPCPGNNATPTPPSAPVPEPAKEPSMQFSIAATATSEGYVTTNERGEVDAFGAAQYHGGANSGGDGNPPLAPGELVTGIATCGSGYVLITSLGGVRAYGCNYHGSPHSATPSESS